MSHFDEETDAMYRAMIAQEHAAVSRRYADLSPEAQAELERARQHQMRMLAASMDKGSQETAFALSVIDMVKDSEMHRELTYSALLTVIAMEMAQTQPNEYVEIVRLLAEDIAAHVIL